MSSSSSSSRAGRNAWLVLAALAAVLLLAVWFRPLESLFRQSATSHASVGKPIPSVTLAPLTDEAAAINPAELSGNVLLVNFWGTWCPPCREELPHLAHMSKSLVRDDFRLIAISCGGEEDLDALASSTGAYLSTTKLNIPAYADPGDKLRQALEEIGAFSGFVPTTLAVDRRGVIRAVWQGYFPGAERDIERVVTSLLVER